MWGLKISRLPSYPSAFMGKITVAGGVSSESVRLMKGILNLKRHPIICFCNSIQTNSYEVANGSYIPTLLTEDKTNEEKPSRKIEAIGAFQKLPMVMPSIDILGSALRKARRVSPTKGIVNSAKREKNKGAKQLDALMKELAVPLRTYVENFPKKTYLHPYERSLIELTLGDGYYEMVLGKIDSLRKQLVSVGKEQASLCAKLFERHRLSSAVHLWHAYPLWTPPAKTDSSSKREAEERRNQGIQKVEDIFAQEGKVVDDLLGIAKTLRAMPVINLETPTLCLVGAPNVGKSSLVRILSTGKPEVCNYPFTTRGILIGHIVLNYQKFQVTDTPGLLKRQYEDRNNLEKLTLAALSHLPTAILYVHDLSGECGTSPADQFIIYKEIREKFSGHLWLDVVSKSDLLEKAPVIYATEDEDPKQLELLKYRKSGPDGALHVSVKTEQGLHELKCRVYELLNLQMAKIK